MRERPDPLAVPDTTNQVWSMDFMHDQLSDGRRFQLFAHSSRNLPPLMIQSSRRKCSEFSHPKRSATCCRDGSGSPIL